jgi:hypothetical protein
MFSAITTHNIHSKKKINTIAQNDNSYRIQTRLLLVSEKLAITNDNK